MFHAYAECSALEGIAMKAAMILPALLLLKPHSRSRTKELVKHLEHRQSLRRMEILTADRMKDKQPKVAWQGKCNGRNKPTDQLSRTMSKLIMEDKVRAALRLIADVDHGA